MPAAPSSRMSSRTSFMPRGSRPLVGSSSTMSSGLCSSAWAMPRRCFMPWLKPPTRTSARSLSATISSTSSMRSSLTGPGHAAQQAEVPARAHERVERRVVDEAADVPQRALELAGHAVAGHLRVAARRVDQAEDEADDGRLAGAVGPEEAEDVALADLHVETVDRAQLPKCLVRRVGREDGGAAVAALLPGPRPLLFTQRRASTTSGVSGCSTSTNGARERLQIALGTMPPATSVVPPFSHTITPPSGVPISAPWRRR